MKIINNRHKVINFAISSILVLSVILNSIFLTVGYNQYKNVVSLTDSLETTKEQLRIKEKELATSKEILLRNQQEKDTSIEEPYDPRVYQTIDSNFMKYAIGHNAKLYMTPDINDKIVGTINDRVLIYNSFHTRQAINTYTSWAFVEYVGEPSSQMESQSFGYVLFDEVELVDDEVTIYDSFGFNNVFIGDSYEKVIGTFGKAKNFYKNDHQWYVFQSNYELTTTFSHLTLTVVEMYIINPKGKNVKINDELSTESSVSDFLKYFDKKGYSYSSKEYSETIFIEVIINDEIMLTFSYFKKDETIAQITILKYPEMIRIS